MSELGLFLLGSHPLTISRSLGSRDTALLRGAVSLSYTILLLILHYYYCYYLLFTIYYYDYYDYYTCVSLPAYFIFFYNESTRFLAIFTTVKAPGAAILYTDTCFPTRTDRISTASTVVGELYRR